MSIPVLDLPAGWTAYDLSDPSEVPEDLTALIADASAADVRPRWLIVRDDAGRPDAPVAVAAVGQTALPAGSARWYQPALARLLSDGWNQVALWPPDGPFHFRRRDPTGREGVELVQDIVVLAGGGAVFALRVYREHGPGRADAAALVDELLAGVSA